MNDSIALAATGRMSSVASIHFVTAITSRIMTRSNHDGCPRSLMALVPDDDGSRTRFVNEPTRNAQSG